MDISFEQSKAKITSICNYFKTNSASFRSPGVKEAHVRQSLIDPFFEHLGWDVRNSAMVAPQYREVIPEDSLDVEGQNKAPDYSFRVGTHTKFFVEAKKCGINIGSDPGPAYQLRRYGWSGKVPLSILTDFEELSVYDCTIKPRQKDKATVARLMYMRFDEYPSRLDQLWNLFSRHAVWSGAFDDYAAKKLKRGTSEVDDEFLKDIEGWRERLAKNFALRNAALSAADLNSAVQRTIDRVVFLRMAEDRLLEPQEQLLKLAEQPDIYRRFMTELCHKADQKYNSGLFHFRAEADSGETPDQLTPQLILDDSVFKRILQGLYFAYGSPYHFGVLSVEILGTVYERFLGKVIRLTKGHQAKVEKKPEVRKAGGVYYTPVPIVNSIVEEAVGKQVAAKTPMALKGSNTKPPFRVLDMACGSGSFLLGAYQRLLDHALAWYSCHAPEKRPRNVYQDRRSKEWRLTIEEKKRILTTHIFGVDIDRQAVEVTKLSLLLKALEGESDVSLSQQLSLFHDRALPNLADNIKCGNSLVGPDYFDAQLLPDATEIDRLNAFAWDREFPDALSAGGFDAVIGNPPWVSLSGRFGNDICPPRQLQYLLDTYKGNTYMPNMYEYFVAKGTRLVKSKGRFAYIVPDRLGYNRQFVALRARILHNFRLLNLTYRLPFPGITADTLCFVLENAKPARQHLVTVSEYGRQPIQIPQAEYLTSKDHAWEYFGDAGEMKLAKRIAAMPHSVELCTVCRTTSGFGGKSSLITDRRTSTRQIETLKGDSIQRYALQKKYWFDFQPANITGRTTDPRKLGAKPKLLLRKTGGTVIATHDASGIYPEQSLYFLYDFQPKISPLYVLALLNSKLMGFYYRTACLTNKASIAQVKKIHLDTLPIRRIDWTSSTDTSVHDKLVKLAENRLQLGELLASARSQSEREGIRRQIAATETAIDGKVYAHYGLTASEIALLQEAVKGS